MDSFNQEDDYAQKYYQLLLKFVSKPKTHSKLYLEPLVRSKIRELSKDSSKNSEKYMQKFLLGLSLYFIKDNAFVSEEYFSLINNKIYKNIYEIFENPTEPQMEKFFKSFYELDYGASTIFSICNELCNNGTYIPMDLFFAIIIKKNRYLLKEILKTEFPIEKSHEKLIQRLACFTKVKNKIEVSKNDILNLFKNQTEDEFKLNKSLISNNNNLKEANDKENEINNDIERNEEIINTDIHIKKKKRGEKNKKKTDKKCEDNLKIENSLINIKDNDNEEKTNKISLNDKEKSDKINIKDEGKFFKYLLEMKKKYELLNYETPVLDYLIKSKNKLKKEYFKYTKNKEVIIDHIYNNLEKLIIELNLNIIDFHEEKYGYFCYQVIEKNEKKYVESIYSIINRQILSDRISSDLNFPKDNFKNPDKNRAQNAFKSRSLSFEYFINNNILIRKYGLDEKARVIYSFRTVDELEYVNENKIRINNKNEEKGLEELDGVIFVNNNTLLDLEKNCFMIDIPYRFGSFIGTDKKSTIQEINEYDNVKNNKENPLNIELRNNTLALIEIKNQFPPYEESNKKDMPINFYHMVKGLIKKAKIFKQIYEQSNKNIKNIKLILFYDVIQKENYYDELKRAVYDSFKKDDEELFDFEFQCVYIKASYLTGGLMNLNDNVDELKAKVNDLQENIVHLNSKLNLLIEFITNLDLPQDKMEKFKLLINQINC